MNRPLVAVAIICLALATLSASASVLTLRLEKTPVSISTQQGDSILRVSFADEPLRGTVKLMIGVVPGLTSADEDTAALRNLEADSWFRLVQFDVSKNGEDFQTLPPNDVKVVGHSGERSGRSDATESGEVRTIEMSFEISGLDDGDYRVRAELGGLRSKPDSVAVRTGRESRELQSVWLSRQALRATSWVEYQRVQLQRAEVDPNNYKIFLDLANRSLRDGSLEETTEYFNRTIDLLNKAFDREAAATPSARTTLRKQQAEAVRPYRDIVAVLPEYYHDRQRLALVPEFSSERLRYVLKEKSSGRVVRVVTEMDN